MGSNTLISGKDDLMLDPSGTYPVKNENVSQKYQHLMEISPRLREEMRGKSLALIFYECSLISLKLNREGNKLTLIFKRESHEQLNEIIKIKVKSYDQVVKNIVLPILEGGFTIAGIAGGNLEIFSRAWQVAVRSADSSLNSGHQAQLAALDHSYKIQSEFSDQYGRSKQDNNQSFEAICRVFEQFLQQLQENFKNVSG